MKTVADLYLKMKANCDDAQQAATLGGRARESASQGFIALSEVQQTLDSFVSSTSDVEKMLTEILTLAHQTHILGVNAAIEAANAGQHGAGFSILANEMRRIAGMVSETTIGVRKTIEATKSLADRTVDAIDTASKSLELLEVSADLSVNLTSTVAVNTQHDCQLLMELFPGELSSYEQDKNENLDTQGN